MICNSNLDGPCMEEVYDEDVVFDSVHLSLRSLHTISYAFPMSRHTAVVVVGWRKLPVSQFLD